jgi:DNA-directed RNA polymerase subunit RPC12/RpoP
MVDTPPRCPDCAVEMEEMTLRASSYNLQFVSDENREGILGSLGVKQRFGSEAYVCSECGLSRLYADLD